MRLALFTIGCIAGAYAAVYGRWFLLAGVILFAAGICLYDAVREGLDTIAEAGRWAREETERDGICPPSRRPRGSANHPAGGALFPAEFASDDRSDVRGAGDQREARPAPRARHDR